MRVFNFVGIVALACFFSFLKLEALGQSDTLFLFGGEFRDGKALEIRDYGILWQDSVKSDPELIFNQHIQRFISGTSGESIWLVPDSLRGRSSYLPEGKWRQQIREMNYGHLLHHRLILREIGFASGTAHLTTKAQQKLDQLLPYLGSSRLVSWQLSGYTDATGSEAANLALSLQRAEAVKAYLVKQGIPEFQLETSGRGIAAPIADNDTPEGREANRRVELSVFALLNGEVKYVDMKGEVPQIDIPTTPDSFDTVNSALLTMPDKKKRNLAFHLKRESVQLKVEVGGGMLNSYGPFIGEMKKDLIVSQETLGDDYHQKYRKKTTFIPVIGVKLHLPIAPYLALGTGLQYQQLSFQQTLETAYQDPAYQYDEVRSFTQRMTSQVICVPIEFRFKVFEKVTGIAGGQLGGSLPRLNSLTTRTYTNVIINGSQDEAWSIPTETTSLSGPKEARSFFFSWYAGTDYLFKSRWAAGVLVQYAAPFLIEESKLSSLAWMSTLSYRLFP